MDPSPPQRGGSPAAPRLGPADRRVLEPVRRARPGDAVVRVTRPKFTGFARRGAGRLEASLTLEEPRGPWGKVWRVVVGAPLPPRVLVHAARSPEGAAPLFSSRVASAGAFSPPPALLAL